MKRIIITEKQLKNFIRLNEYENNIKVPIDTEALNDQTPDERNATLIALKQLDNKPNTDVVAPVDLSKINTSNSDILKTESKINEGQDDISENIVDTVVKYIITNYANELEDSMLTISSIKDIIQDAYIDVTGEEIDYNDKNVYREIMYKIINHTMNNKNPKMECVKISKKQIKEAQKNKRIAESKVITKSDFMKNLK
jgi:hypothetical protein